MWLVSLVEQLLDVSEIEYQEIGHDHRQNLRDEDFHGIGGGSWKTITKISTEAYTKNPAVNWAAIYP